MAERKQGDQGTGDRSAVITQTKTRTQRPSMYRVLILNDDYTPMEFVVYVLEQYFHKSREEATRIMLHVHQTGVGVCGVYTYEVAETKVAQVIDTARRQSRQGRVWARSSAGSGVDAPGTIRGHTRPAAPCSSVVKTEPPKGSSEAEQASDTSRP